MEDEIRKGAIMEYVKGTPPKPIKMLGESGRHWKNDALLDLPRFSHMEHST